MSNSDDHLVSVRERLEGAINAAAADRSASLGQISRERREGNARIRSSKEQRRQNLAAQASKSGESAKIAECLWHEGSDSQEFGCAVFAVGTAKDCTGLHWQRTATVPKEKFGALSIMASAGFWRGMVGPWTPAGRGLE